jgi:hypothetical protein
MKQSVYKDSPSTFREYFAILLLRARAIGRLEFGASSPHLSLPNPNPPALLLSLPWPSAATAEDFAHLIPVLAKLLDFLACFIVPFRVYSYILHGIA